MCLRSFRQADKDHLGKLIMIYSRRSNHLSYQTRIGNNLGFYSEEDTLEQQVSYFRVIA